MQASYRSFAIVVIGFLAIGTPGIDWLYAENWNGPERPRWSSESAHWRESQSCGVACAYMLARLVGQEVDYSDAVAAIPIEKGGSSLLDLQEGLRTMGVSAAILKAKPAELDRMTMPVIAHLLPRRETSDSVGHFLLLLQVDERFVRYIEPNYATSIETVPRNQFLRCWSGYLVAPTPRKTPFEGRAEFAMWSMFAILASIGSFPAVRVIRARVWGNPKRVALLSVVGAIGVSCVASGCAVFRPNLGVSRDGSERRIGTQHVPHLVAWNTEADLGVIPSDGTREALFRIENLGDATVQLHLGSPTCRCSQARLDKESLGPGQATNVRMLMRSRPRQAGPADARVYVEAEGGTWAEALIVHGVELGANFPDYTYVVGGPAPVRTASVAGSLFLKSSKANPKVDVSLKGSGSESLLSVRDLRIGPPVEMADCVRRECSFTVALGSKVSGANERREVVLPVSVNVDGELSTHSVRLTVLPSRSSTADPAR
ncbi:MAG TPA: cysteine peptidase family C39 domain-containing protein [Planctomycetaceae bacterium]|nr:cysteine peptidase family C39 domain-containing protein [Planctomycetaceae bacterium]